MGITVSDFLAIRWGATEGPLIEPPRFSPIIADPSFLFPEETPGGRWELFAHSAWGIHRFSSADGLSWRDHGIVIQNAMRPFVRRLGGSTEVAAISEATAGTAAAPRQPAHATAEYVLLFESYPPFALPLSALPFKRKWNSTIVIAHSGDLDSWSPREIVLKADLPWMRDPELGASVSNPCLVEEPGSAVGWRLHFSASLSWIPDCGFCEPRYLACARGTSPFGPFEPLAQPILDPASDPVPGVLGAGSMKIIACEDGWIGLQNKIYRDIGGRSRSAIFVLRSKDGLAWTPAGSEPLLSPQAGCSLGWTRSHVYACDCRFREKDGLWYLYFNARDGWKISEGKERIGRIVGRS
ncbi:MAG: glycosyl hydrolase family 43 [Spirochaetes bacterium]|nr:glycosyl hydrolase family 43 [Spirochaetota bacterium]